MKYFFSVIFITYSLFVSANNESDELGRSLANYQACAQVAVDIDDRQMFVYYQKMLNDTRLSILSFNEDSAKQVYSIWLHSEDILNKIPVSEIQKICLSRFDQLSRQMSGNRK